MTDAEQTDWLEREPLTDDEIKEIAIGIRAGTVFTDRSFRDGEHPTMISAVFMPLALIGSEQILALANKIQPDEQGPMGMIYEWLDKAGSRSVNGYPIFYSFRWMTPEEVDRVNEVMAALAEV